MGTIAEKLSYLNDTKELFKDRLNSLGAEITSSTTFRNYLNWLDTFYNEVSDKTDISQNGVVGRTSQNTAILPSEYTQVDYIESSGTQYIDTGYIPKLNDIYNIEFAPTAEVNPQVFFGSRSSGTYSTSKDQIYFNASRKSSVDNTMNYYIGTTENNLEVFILNQKYTYTINTIDGNFNNNSNQEIYIFALNNIGQKTANSNIKLYKFSVTNNNLLVRDFIPCYRNSDNEVGLYDLVNDVFYTNQGTGAFTYGSVVSIPNPDYPLPINNLSGDVAYKVSGKNKLNSSNIVTGTKNGITTSYNPTTQEITFNGTCTYDNTPILVSTDNIPFIRNKTKMIAYYVDGTISGSGLFRTFRGNGAWDLYSGVSISTLNSLNPIVQVTGSNTDVKARTDFRFDNGTILTNFKIKLMITDSEDTTYEPYIEPQTFNIPLGDIELCKINTYEDKIYSSNGRFYLYKNIGKVVLNGSESWKQSSVRAEVHNILLDDMLPPTTSSTTYINGISNTFLNGASYNQLTATATYMNYYNRMSATNDKYMSFSYEFTTSINDWKTWLSTHNIIAYYVLLEATTTEITQENYPSLYNALKQIQDYLTAYKINKEFILGYSSPEIEY